MIILWIVLAIVGGFVALLVLLALLGLRLPRDHKATVSARFERGAAELFAHVADPARWPSWNQGVKKVERLPDVNGREAWLFHDRNGKLPSVVLERTAPSDGAAGRFVTEISDPKLPFGGRWIWQIGADGVVTITEDGEIRNPLFRFLARYVFGYTSTAEATLRSLGKAVGEQTTPTIVDAGR
jgi:hypothetical protein